MKTLLLKNLTDSELLNETEKAVSKERECTNLVLEHLREVQSRRLYAKLGYSSMFLYCTEHLKYCNASAQLRIDAMRLSMEVPEIKGSLESGSLNLSVIGTFQRFVRHEESNNKTYSTEEKKEFIKQIENKSKEEAEKLFSEISPEMIPKEKKRVLSPTQTEIRFIADEELLKLMDQMKCKLMQKGKSNPSFAEIIGAALKKALKTSKIEVQCNATSSDEVIEEEKNFPAVKKNFDAKLGSGIEANQKPEGTSSAEVKSPTKNSTRNRPYIPVSTRRAVLNKAGHQCTFVSPITGQRCSETRFLEIEHIVPFAKNGSSDLSNLTALCSVHNLTQAIDEFGIEKMRPFLRL